LRDSEPGGEFQRGYENAEFLRGTEEEAQVLPLVLETDFGRGVPTQVYPKSWIYLDLFW
jgi:hypothetical protein